MATPNSKPERSRGLRNLLAGAALAMAMANAHGQESRPGTVWKCWYNQDTRIQCMLAATSAEAAADPRYTENPMLPLPVKQIWTNAQSLADKKVFIPLYTEPDDWERVRLLAQSVMCGANRDCSVEFSRSFVEAALLDPSLDP